MPSNSSVPTRTGYTLTQAKKSNEVIALIAHSLFVAHHKKKPFPITKILKDAGLNYQAALRFKDCMVQRKTVVPVSREFVQFRDGIAEPSNAMVSNIIDGALCLQRTPVAKSKPITSYDAKELVERLRLMGYTVECYIKL